MTSEQTQLSVPALLASLAHSEHQVEQEPSEEDVAQAARNWELTPTEAFLEGKAAGLAQAQDDIRDKAGWPVEHEPGKA